MEETEKFCLFCSSSSCGLIISATWECRIVEKFKGWKISEFCLQKKFILKEIYNERVQTCIIFHNMFTHLDIFHFIIYSAIHDSTEWDMSVCFQFIFHLPRALVYICAKFFFYSIHILATQWRLRRRISEKELPLNVMLFESNCLASERGTEFILTYQKTSRTWKIFIFQQAIIITFSESGELFRAV